MKVAHIGQKQYFTAFCPSSNQGSKIKHTFYHVNFDPLHPERFNFVKDLKEDVAVFYCAERMPIEKIKQFRGKKVWYSTEPIYRGGVSDQYARTQAAAFDLHIHYDPSQKLPESDVIYQPLPVDLDTYNLGMSKHGRGFRDFDAIFFGRSTPEREQFLQPIEKDYEVLHIGNGLWGNEIVEFMHRSHHGINLHATPFAQWEPRIQLMLACGLPVLTQRVPEVCRQELKTYIYEFDTPIQLLNLVSGLAVDHEKFRERSFGYIKEKLDAKKVWAEIIDNHLSKT